jgi:hypothetical protein
MFLECSYDWRRMAPLESEANGMVDWLTPVDDYLYSTGRVGLEQVLCDGCLSGRVPPAVAAVASVAPELVNRVSEEDGGAAETYRGALTVAGIRYSFEVLLFADGDGAYFVANIARFEPVEWTAGMQVA